MTILQQETSDNGPEGAAAEGEAVNRTRSKGRSRRSVTYALAAVGLAVALVGAFVGGYAFKDDVKGQRDDLLVRVDNLTGERNGINDDLIDANSRVEHCTATVTGYQDYAAQADDLIADGGEFLFKVDQWWNAAPGSAEEAQVASELQLLDAHMQEQMDKMARDIGGLEAQAGDCLE
jgi:hypothetical protein